MFTPLHYAAMDGKTEIATVLIKSGANLNTVSKVSIKYLLYYILVMCPLQSQCNQLPLLQYWIISTLSLHLLQQKYSTNLFP